MKRLLATIKAPAARAEELRRQLSELGVDEVEVKTVPYERFVEESRLNYDCVFPEMWQEKQDVCYLDFSFDATQEGRDGAFKVEYGLMQVPLNLRYEF